MIKTCPFCHHEKAELAKRAELLRDGTPRDIYRCSECGLLYPKPRMDEAESARFIVQLYDGEGKAAIDDPTTATDNFTKRKFLQPKGYMVNLGLLVRNYVPSGSAALDIGTFSGSFCYVLKYLGLDAYGLEPYAGAVDFARSKGLEVYEGFFPETVPEEIGCRKYSLISFLECIFYFIDLKKSIDKARDMLQEGGYLLLKCHQACSPYYKGGKNSLFKRFGDNIQFFPLEGSLKYCLEHSGFEVVFVSGTISEPTAPFNFADKISGGPAKKVLNLSQALLNKFYDSAFTNASNADQVIMIAKKAGR